jgi:hypothetical protein
MKKILFLTAIAFLLISCGNNSADNKETKENKKDAGSSSGDNIITFKVDGNDVSSTGWVVQRFVWDDKTPGVWINITSSMHKDKRTINVNLKGGTAGKYSFSENSGVMESSHGSYFPDFSSPMINYLFATGEFNITEVDTVNNMLSGTFFGTVKNMQGSTLTISDGKIVNAKLTPGIVNLSTSMDEFGN